MAARTPYFSDALTSLLHSRLHSKKFGELGLHRHAPVGAVVEDAVVPANPAPSAGRPPSSRRAPPSPPALRARDSKQVKFSSLLQKFWYVHTVFFLFSDWL